jgi:tRNA dimethylallyltransferase
MKNKIIIICGPTAVGKTALAIQLAKLINGAIVACDSRQVYRGLDIGTGKDKSNLGCDLADPNEPFSAMNYATLIQPVIESLLKSGQTPILTTGTGLYLKQLFNPPQTGMIKPNAKLREQLDQLSLIQLQEKLQRLNPEKWRAMNHSDQHNPRRLIRALEVSVANHSNHLAIKPFKYCDLLYLGLTAPLEVLDARINARVLARATPEFTRELKKLISLYPNFTSLPAATATGYQEWLDYLKHQTTRAKAISLWQLHERQYARRQLTWLKKMPHLHWFDITDNLWQESVVELVQTWYS